MTQFLAATKCAIFKPNHKDIVRISHFFRKMNDMAKNAVSCVEIETPY